MPTEPNYRRVGDLDKGLPTDSDPVREGSIHLRGLKSSLLGNLFSSASEVWIRLAEGSATLAKVLTNTVRILRASGTAAFQVRNAADNSTELALTYNGTDGRLEVPNANKHLKLAADGYVGVELDPDEATIIRHTDGREVQKSAANGVIVGGNNSTQVRVRLRQGIDDATGLDIVYAAPSSLATIGGPDDLAIVKDADFHFSTALRDSYIWAGGVERLRAVETAGGFNNVELKGEDNNYRQALANKHYRVYNANWNLNAGDNGGHLAVGGNGIVATIIPGNLPRDFECEIWLDLGEANYTFDLNITGGTLRVHFTSATFDTQSRTAQRFTEGGPIWVRRRADGTVFDVYGPGAVRNTP